MSRNLFRSQSRGPAQIEIHSICLFFFVLFCFAEAILTLTFVLNVFCEFSSYTTNTKLNAECTDMSTTEYTQRLKFAGDDDVILCA